MAGLPDLIYQTPTIRGQQIVDPPLRSNEYISIGYGGLGIQHLVVGIREHGMEVGSLKVFLSTEFIDFAGIAQESPFRNSRGIKQHIPPRRPYLQSTAISFVARALPTNNRTRGAIPLHVGPVVSSFMSLTEHSQLKRSVQFSCIAATTHHIPDVNQVDDLGMRMEQMNIQREPNSEALYAQSRLQTLSNDVGVGDSMPNFSNFGATSHPAPRYQANHPLDPPFPEPQYYYAPDHNPYAWRPSSNIYQGYYQTGGN